MRQGIKVWLSGKQYSNYISVICRRWNIQGLICTAGRSEGKMDGVDAQKNVFHAQLFVHPLFSLPICWS